MHKDKTLIKRRILIVEDDELMAEQLDILLTHLGYEVADTCRSGEAAVKSALAFNPDLILMDIVLEGKMDGIQSAIKIREFRKTPVIYITGHTDTDLFERSAHTEPFGYLVKPYKERELEATLRIAFHHSDLEKKLTDSEKHLSDAQRIGMLGSWKWDIINNTLEWSDQMFNLFGMEAQSFGANHESFMKRVHPEDREHVQLAIDSSLAGNKHYCIDYRIITTSKAVRIIHAEGEVLFNDEHVPSQMTGTANDVTSYQETQQQLWHMAYHDPLTGLPNRTLFADRLEQALSRANRTHEKVAVMLIDLDHFKQVNDTLGHDAGDQLLIEVASKLDDILRGDDTLSRVGGDEFLAILNTLNTYDEAIVVARKLVAAVEKITTIDDNEINVSCSIGIAMYPDHGHDKDTLIKNADIAMYRAKDLGKDTFCLFEEEKTRLREVKC